MSLTDLTDIDQIENENEDKETFFENSSFNSLMISYVLFFLVVAFHVLVSIKSPNFFREKKDFNSFKGLDGNQTVECEYDVKGINNLYVFVDIKAALIRKNGEGLFKLPIDFGGTMKLIRKGISFEEEKIPPEEKSVLFYKNSLESVPFNVMVKKVKFSESIKINLKIQADFDIIQGISFIIRTEDPNSRYYFKAIRILMSFMIGYISFVYICNLKIGESYNDNNFNLLIGVLGFFSSNPLSIFFPNYFGNPIIDNVSIAIFIGVFKLTMLIVIEKLNHKQENQNLNTMFFTAIIFVIYIIICSSAFDERGKYLNSSIISNKKKVFKQEKLMIYFDLFYVFYTTWILINLFCNKYSYYKRRIVFLAILFFLINSVTLFSNAYCILKNRFMLTNLRMLLLISIHITSASFFIYFFHDDFNLLNGYKKVHSEVTSCTDEISLHVEKYNDSEIENLK